MGSKKQLFSGIAGICLMMGFISERVYAENWSAGLLGAYVSQNESGADSRNGFGFQYGKKITDTIDLGFWALFTSVTNDSLGWAITISDNFPMFYANYYWPQVKGFYTGIKLGGADRRAKRLLDPDMGEVSAMGLGWGVETGYEYQLSSAFVLGAGISYISAGSASTTIQSGGSDLTITFDSTSFVNLLLSAKYLF